VCHNTFEQITGYQREEILTTDQKIYGSVTSMADGILYSSEVHIDPLGTTERTSVTAGEYGKHNQNSNNSDPPIASSRNLSLFNLLRRDCIENVFLAPSRILKHPNREGEGDEDKHIDKIIERDFGVGMLD
jgi:hypothetical protein